MIQHAFEDLSQSLRVLLEADWRANAGLMDTDRAEAVGNIETALSGVLHSFHSLYDAMKKEGVGGPDWYSEGPLALVLAIRNARHHNKANRIRTLYTFHVQEAERPDRMEQYVLVDFPGQEEGADTFNVFMSWMDLKALLEMPEKESRLRPDTRKTIARFLRSDRFRIYARHYDLPEERVFFNIVPLFVTAGATVVPSVSSHLAPASTGARFFADHFSTVVPADMDNHEVAAGPFVLPA